MKRVRAYINGKQRREYMVWSAMKQRCNNLLNKSYHNYGGRGITYDSKWELFENFFRDMGECPIGYTLERIDNDGPYSASNCRWASHIDQHRNTCRSVYLIANGRTQIQGDWARELGVRANFIHRKTRKGQTM